MLPPPTDWNQHSLSRFCVFYLQNQWREILRFCRQTIFGSLRFYFNSLLSAVMVVTSIDDLQLSQHHIEKEPKADIVLSQVENNSMFGAHDVIHLIILIKNHISLLRINRLQWTMYDSLHSWLWHSRNQFLKIFLQMHIRIIIPARIALWWKVSHRKISLFLSTDSWNMALGATAKLILKNFPSIFFCLCLSFLEWCGFGNIGFIIFFHLQLSFSSRLSLSSWVLWV